MNLEPILEAAKIVPVYMRNEQAAGPGLDPKAGCYACTHNNVLRYDHRFTTVVAYGIDEDTGEWEDPLFGLTLSHNDGSYQELRQRHWLRGSIQGRTGFYHAWTAAETVHEDPILFVRLLNRFTGGGVEHTHRRFDFGAPLRSRNYHDEIYLKIWEPHYTRVGIYVEPVAELLDGEKWSANEINLYVSSAYRNVERINSLIQYYWKNLLNARLTPLKALEERNLRDLRDPHTTAALQRELERAMERINLNVALDNEI